MNTTCEVSFAWRTVPVSQIWFQLYDLFGQFHPDVCHVSTDNPDHDRIFGSHNSQVSLPAQSLIQRIPAFWQGSASFLLSAFRSPISSAKQNWKDKALHPLLQAKKI